MVFKYLIVDLGTVWLYYLFPLLFRFENKRERRLLYLYLTSWEKHLREEAYLLYSHMCSIRQSRDTISSLAERGKSTVPPVAFIIPLYHAPWWSSENTFGSWLISICSIRSQYILEVHSIPRGLLGRTFVSIGTCLSIVTTHNSSSSHLSMNLQLDPEVLARNQGKKWEECVRERPIFCPVSLWKLCVVSKVKAKMTLQVAIHIHLLWKFIALR